MLVPAYWTLKQKYRSGSLLWNRQVWNWLILLHQTTYGQSSEDGYALKPLSWKNRVMDKLNRTSAICWRKWKVQFWASCWRKNFSIWTVSLGLKSVQHLKFNLQKNRLFKMKTWVKQKKLHKALRSSLYLKILKLPLLTGRLWRIWRDHICWWMKGWTSRISRLIL